MTFQPSAQEAATVRSALRKLGPERCQQALAAFTDPKPVINWSRCALARAFGPPNELRSAVALRNPEGFPSRRYYSVVAALLGLDIAEVHEVARFFDWDGVSRAWLQTEFEAVAALAFGCSRLNHSETLT